MNKEFSACWVNAPFGTSLALLNITIDHHKQCIQDIQHKLQHRTDPLKSKRLKGLNTTDTPHKHTNSQVKAEQLFLMKQTGKHMYTKGTRLPLEVHIQKHHTTLSRHTRTEPSQPPTNYSNNQTDINLKLPHLISTTRNKPNNYNKNNILKCI